MDTLLDFSDSVAVITGAASGFGKLLARELANRQCKLVISDINEEALKHTVDELETLGADVASMSCDVSDEAQCKAQVELAMSRFGKVTLAVNNAGIAHDMSPTHQIEKSVIDTQMAVNVNGVLFGMKYQLQAMLQQGKGHILNVSSMAGIGGAPKGGAYAAAKHAVVGLTRTAAVEYARLGVQVNAICPFYSPTNIMTIEGLSSDDDRKKLAMGSPMKRLADPQEIVNVMLLMLSPGNTYMTGQTIAVDGGVSAW